MKIENHHNHQPSPQNKADKRMKIKVAELFAGVGGFRLGLEGFNGKSARSGYRDDLDSPFETVWNNQWEPSTKKQIASEIYQKRFGSDGHSCKDIAQVLITEIPDHDLLVGGFPCQDYSIANRSGAKGLAGKKASSGGRYIA